MANRLHDRIEPALTDRIREARERLGRGTAMQTRDPDGRLRVLLVSRYFPPVNASGAVRLGKMARYLVAAGHDVRVLTSDRKEADASLPLEIDPARVLRTPWLDLDGWVDPRNWWPRARGAGAASTVVAEPRGAGAGRSWLRAVVSELYRNGVLYPDRSIGWCVHLLPALNRMMRNWRPDIVLVSGPPFSAFIAVAVAARRAGVPWVAEFRDRWADDMYTLMPGWRRRLDARVERQLVSRAAGIVTVSAPWAEAFGFRYRVPVATVMNGFDPAELPPSDDAPESGLPLRVLHLGTIYPERRDPRPLFRALHAGGFTPDEVRLVFYGSGLEWVGARSRECGADGFVETHAQVPRSEALRLQRQADILLLLQWDDCSEVGNVPAKLFEYLAARRPILGLGPLDGVPARVVRERDAGFLSNNVVELAAQLRLWVEQKRSDGQVPPLRASAYQGLGRDDQYRILENFLQLVVRGWDGSRTSLRHRSSAAPECG